MHEYVIRSTIISHSIKQSWYFFHYMIVITIQVFEFKNHIDTHNHVTILLSHLILLDHFIEANFSLLPNTQSKKIQGSIVTTQA